MPDPQPSLLSSPYAPIAVEGPLPPAFTETLLRASFHAVGLPPKRALKVLDPRSSNLPTAKRLRYLLDDPRARSQLARAKPGAGLHDAIYWYVRRKHPRGRGVYRRVVEPATFERGRDKQVKTFLAPDRFVDQVRREFNSATEASRRIEQQSEDEALALLVLAFGLLQPEDAPQLVRPLVEAGLGFREFFGVTIALDRGPAPEPTDSQDPASAPGGPQSLPVELPLDTDWGDRAPPPLGKWTARLEQCSVASAAANARRRRAGGAAVLDRGEFDEAAREEAAALAALNASEGELERLISERAAQAQACARRLVGEVTLNLSCPIESSPKAAWFDVSEALFEEISAEAKRIDETRDVLARLDGEGSVADATCTKTQLTLQDLLEELSKRRTALELAVEEAQGWVRTVEALRMTLAPCAGPARAMESIETVSQDAWRSVLLRCVHDDKIAPLTPLTVRALAEREHWENNKPSNETVEALVTCLRAAARNEDSERLYDVASFLTIPQLQALLRTNHDELARYVLLITFRNALARESDVFFTSVWPCAGWSHRQQSAGAALTRALDDLHQAFLTTGDLEPVFELVCRVKHTSDSQPTDDFSNRQEERRRQRADDLANLLRRDLGMNGNHHLLRHTAANLYFRPLAALVKERRTTDVRRAVVALRQRFESGELVAEIIRELPRLRVALEQQHRATLHRYLEAKIASLEAWLADESRLAGDGRVSTCSHDAGAQPVAVFMGTASKPVDDVGSVRWLEGRVRRILCAFQDNEPPTPTFCFLGEFPDVDDLFGGATPGTCPDWLDPDPRSERLWACHCGGLEVTWQDLFQDAIARTLLERRRTPPEILTSFLQCGMHLAVVEAAVFDEFGKAPDCRALIDQAREALKLAEEVERKLYDLDERIQALREWLSAKAEIPALEGEYLQVLESREGPAARLSVLETLEGRLASLERRVREESARRLEQTSKFRDWLKEAQVTLPAGASLDEALALVASVKKEAGARRRHLQRLEELTDRSVPEPLRTEVRRYLDGADRPSAWPRDVEDADSCVDLLVTRVREWVALRNQLQPGEPTFERIDHVLACVSERLPRDLTAFIETSDESQAPIFMALLETQTFAEYHRNLAARGLVASMGAEDIGAVEVSSQTFAFAWEQVLREARELVNEARVSNGSGEDVQDTFDALARGDLEGARDAARRALAWATENAERSEFSDPLTAVHFWVTVRNSERPRDDRLRALALLFRFSDVLHRRANLDEQELVLWLSREFLVDTAAEPHVALEGLERTLVELSTGPIGDGNRELLATFMQIAPAAEVSEWIWRALDRRRKGAAKSAREAKVALLTLLHQFGESEALDRLIERFGEGEQKYLKAFLAMVGRAVASSNTRLQSTIRDTFKGMQARAKGTRSPLLEFAERLLGRLGTHRATLGVEVASELERDSSLPDVYHLLLTLRPEESDPPLELRLRVLGDFESFDGERTLVTHDEPLLDPREFDVLVKPMAAAASHVAINIVGETASGQRLEQDLRTAVSLGTDANFVSIPQVELLDIYEGYDARPVSGRAFVGRKAELAALEQSLARRNPGAVILYGVRRLGKTSLLRAVREQFCLTHRPQSRTLFVMVPVDSLELSPGRPFLECFFRLIHSTAVLHDPLNEPLRIKLAQCGRTQKDLQLAARFDDEDMAFIDKLRTYLSRLLALFQGKAENVVLVCDEFDKTVESYRKGCEAEVQELLNQLRHIATEEANFGLLLAGSDLMQGVIEQYRSALHGSATVIKLECFDQKHHREAARLIVAPKSLKQRRVFSDLVIETIVQVTGGHPLFMRLVALASAHISVRRHISRGTVHEAVHRLLKNEILQGDLTDPMNTVKQPLQALALLGGEKDEILGRLLLLRLSRSSTLERPHAQWAAVSHDETLLSLAPERVWVGVRDRLFESRLLVLDNRHHWGLRFPILAEALRLSWDFEFERYRLRALALRDDTGVAR